MLYHVLYIYNPLREPERWLQKHTTFEWEMRPVTWEEMQLLYRLLKAKERARTVFVYAIKSDDEYMGRHSKCMYSKGQHNTNKSHGGTDADFSDGSGGED